MPLFHQWQLLKLPIDESIEGTEFHPFKALIILLITVEWEQNLLKHSPGVKFLIATSDTHTTSNPQIHCSKACKLKTSLPVMKHEQKCLLPVQHQICWNSKMHKLKVRTIHTEFSFLEDLILQIPFSFPRNPIIRYSERRYSSWIRGTLHVKSECYWKKCKIKRNSEPSYIRYLGILFNNLSLKDSYFFPGIGTGRLVIYSSREQESPIVSQKIGITCQA